jgi:hypothetical protein
MKHPKFLIATIWLLLMIPFTARSEYNSSDPYAMVFRYPPVDNYHMSVGGKTYFQILIDKNLIEALSLFPNKHDDKWTIPVKLTWIDPGNISHGAWKGGKAPLQDSVTIKGKGSYGDGGAFTIDNNKFWIPGKWRVKGCIDDFKIHICTERSFIVPIGKPVSGEAPAQAIKNPAAVLPPVNSTEQPGRGSGFAPVAPGNRKPVTRQTPQGHTTR